MSPDFTGTDQQRIWAKVSMTFTTRSDKKTRYISTSMQTHDNWIWTLTKDATEL